MYKFTKTCPIDKRIAVKASSCKDKTFAALRSSLAFVLVRNQIKMCVHYELLETLVGKTEMKNVPGTVSRWGI